MTEEKQTEASEDGNQGSRDESQEHRSAKEKVEDGIRQGLGVLSAFKDALEETIQEARDRGDLSTERAKEVMKDALGKAQSAAEDAKGRLEFVNQADLDGVKSAVATIRERVGALEEHVFGASRDTASAKGEGSDASQNRDGEDADTGSE